MTTKCCSAIVALASLFIATLAVADWRADLRAQMSPDRCLFEVLDAQIGGGVLVHSLGQHDVDLLWNGVELNLYVDSEPVLDFDQWIEDDGSTVLAFVSHEGRGSFGATGTMGLRGWVYLDDLGNLRVELDVEEETTDDWALLSTVFKVDQTGLAEGVTLRLPCMCRKGNDDWVQGGCSKYDCASNSNCSDPGLTGLLCEYKTTASVVDFEVAFEIMIE